MKEGLGWFVAPKGLQGVSTPGIYPRRRALKGRKSERDHNMKISSRNNMPESLALALSHIVFSFKKRIPFLQSTELRSNASALRPFRANRFIRCFPGLKPRAESCGPFGAKSHPKSTLIFAPFGSGSLTWLRDRGCQESGSLWNVR